MLRWKLLKHKSCQRAIIVKTASMTGCLCTCYDALPDHEFCLDDETKTNLVHIAELCSEEERVGSDINDT